ncbi:aconitate hydratase AcnA [Billgrantia aerodenitrificans]|uniref:Aconitate hydratase n=1 Tax=Billgrantia aerodenitrificans TaxID=2733483 RepID=A0ABS9AN87_9GAMM|nr:aconitate hydratase AcnA [Halomonas aerodenitrificans]MCE8023166.1 aconitate hydratase AcnA [Halomonas aerodenitrificans]
MKISSILNQQLPGRLSFHGQDYAFVDLPGLFGARLRELPMVLRLLLENVVRHGQGEERERSVEAIFDWLGSGTSQDEIAFQPGRVLMHDTTSTPALVDIAAMRDAVAEAGGDPAALTPCLPVDVSVDHSLAVEVFATGSAAEENLQHEMRRNRERYRFLRWASGALEGVRIHPPGTGIMHTVNLEQLATVVITETREGEAWLVPDVMLGTDSHTPMINGIGVLGWGVGGLEAETVMFGMPTMLRIPEVIGVRLVGALAPEAQATDLALVVTKRLRELDVTGKFVEFFGPGVSSLTAGDRAVVANMAPEYGATTGFFAVDDQTLRYLRETGRSSEAVAQVETYCRAAGLWFDPQARPTYTASIEIDLSAIGVQVAGPTRPQDLHAYGEVPRVLDELDFTPAQASDLPRHPVAIAAITSCTNTSDPRLIITAGLLARNARRHGLAPPAWVKTSLAPGSPAAATYLKRAGLLEDLAAVGFDIVGYGCTTCIGNPGPLTREIAEAQAAGTCRAVAILSGNRNFPGRVHPELDLGFIMSPALVVAFGLVGNAEHDLQRQPLGRGNDGANVYLRDLWPSREEVDAAVAGALDAADFAADFQRASRNMVWEALDAPQTARFPWDENSTALRRPPFASVAEGSQLGHYTAYPLLVLGDDVTTDHISPASAIPPDSLVADFLVARGERRDDLNVFASRRGNWEVMVRAAFHNKSLNNRLAPGAPVAHTQHVPSGEVIPILDAAERYRAAGESVVVVAGERYGMGSSRDWAAKGQRLLGVRAVLAVSFERIHRSNLIGMGILPLAMPQGMSAASLAIGTGDRLEIEAEAGRLVPRAEIPVTVWRASGESERFLATVQVETQAEIALLEAGGVIPSILRQTLNGTTEE